MPIYHQQVEELVLYIENKNNECEYASENIMVRDTERDRLCSQYDVSVIRSQQEKVAER